MQGDSLPDYSGNRCVECHQGLEGKLGQPVAEWLGSVHAKTGVACDGCHGGDTSSDQFAHSPASGFSGVPRLRDVPYFCGKCHEDIKEKHLGSPHGAQGLPNCVTCHGNHGIQKPVPEQIITEEACSKCHSFEPAAKALQSLAKARELLRDLDDLANRLRHIPGVTEEVAEVQKEMKLDPQGIVTTFHSFRIGNIEQIGMNVDRLTKTVKRLEERELQRQQHVAREVPFILILMTFLILASAFGYVVYHGKGTVEPGK